MSCSSSSSSSARHSRRSRASTRLGLCALVAVFPSLVGANKDGWSETKDEQGKVVQQLKIEAPAITEEDQYGYTMPDRYKCDSCKAVMFHLDAALRKKQPQSRRLKQWEYTDVIDETCRAGFENYGIKLINGENTLRGPGLPREESLAPGMGAIQMSSDNWNERLGEVCRKIVFEAIQMSSDNWNKRL